MELKHHPEEWFFLHNFDADRVFNTIQRADYLILYYIKMEADQHPEQTIYLADLAAVDIMQKVTAVLQEEREKNS